RGHWGPGRRWHGQSTGSSRPFQLNYARCTVMSLSLEWILDQDSILAFRACGKQSNRTTHQFFDPANIFDRLRRQVGPGARIGGGFLPAFDRLVDRLDPRLSALARRQIVDFLAVEEIAGADLDGVEAVENIELG